MADSGLMGEVLSSLQTELLATFKGVEVRCEKTKLQEKGEFSSWNSARIDLTQIPVKLETAKLILSFWMIFMDIDLFLFFFFFCFLIRYKLLHKLVTTSRVSQPYF